MTGTQTAGEEAILPEVPGSPASGVEVLRIPSMYPPEQDCQRIFMAWDRYQVDVIAHDAPSQQPNP